MNSNHNKEPLLPRMSVGVMGSAGGKMEDKAGKLANSLGAAIARRGGFICL